ncbi:MAG: carboxylesterase family protein [Frankiales bacterium]|nr:carboxylesterase family protein [Frankiales bacterium]
MPTLYLVVAAAGLVAVLNAVRPLRATLVLLPAFFSAWLTAELAPQLVVATILETVVFVLLGAVNGTRGLLALLLSALTLAGLARLIRSSESAADVADRALGELPDGPEPDSDVEATSRLRRFFVPMSFTHPDVERIVDVPYSDVSKRHRLDVYRHHDHPTGCPTLLQVHGGGWVIGDKKEQGRPLMLHLASRGWVCFAPNYRLSPRATWPDHLVDVKRALAWVREHGSEYGADPGFVVLTGGSAGGHLVALAALTANDPRYQPGFEDVDTSVSGCVPYYGVYDLVGETGTKAAKVRRRHLLDRIVMKTTDDQVYRDASPIEAVRPDAPPFLVIHGRNDTLVPVAEARLFVERLRAVSTSPVVYVELPGTQHAFDVFPSIRSAHVVRAVGRFVELLRLRARVSE